MTEEFGILAENTGGRAYTSTNTPWEGVPQVFRENSSYYLLGFRPNSGTPDGRFRKITVKVSRPGVEVRARAGYYAVRADQATKPSTKRTPTAIEQALSKGLPTGDVPLSLSAVATPVTGIRDAAVAVVAGFGAIDDAPKVERMDMAAAAFTDAWKRAGTVTQTIELATRESDGRRAMTDAPLRLDLKPGRYEIRLAVHSATTERTGSVYASLTVPDFAKAALALSGVQIVRNGAGSPVPTATDLSLPWPAGVTTRRAFRQDETVSAVVRVSQIGARRPSMVTMTTTFQDQEGAEVSRDTRELPLDLFQTSRIVEHRATLPLGRLQLGEYLLTFEARDGTRIEHALVRFTVAGFQR